MQHPRHSNAPQVVRQHCSPWLALAGIVGAGPKRLPIDAKGFGPNNSPRLGCETQLAYQYDITGTVVDANSHEYDINMRRRYTTWQSILPDSFEEAHPVL